MTTAEPVELWTLDRPGMLVAPCSLDAARYAVERWHYSTSMPAGKLARFGVWEGGRFVGAVVFGRGSTPKIGAFAGLSDQREVCELVRVALDRHAAPTTQAVAAAIRQLRSTSPGLRLVVSYADSEQGHRGVIYQAGNWTYTGAMQSWTLVVAGKRVHPRTANRRWGTCDPAALRDLDLDAERIELPPKHRYAYPLDRAMRRTIAALAVPAP